MAEGGGGRKWRRGCAEAEGVDPARRAGVRKIRDKPGRRAPRGTGRCWTGCRMPEGGARQAQLR